MSAFAQVTESPQTITVDGRLYEAGSATEGLVDASVVMRVQILNPAKSCILYEEQHTFSTLATSGHFNIQVGSAVGDLAKRSALDSANSMATVFYNRNTPITGKTSGGGGCAYTPASEDIRHFRFFVTPSTVGTTSQLSPDMRVDSVPQALVAQTLQGLGKDDVFKTSVTSTQAKLDNLLTTNYTNITDLIGGTSSMYLRNSSTGTLLPTRPNDPSTPAAGQLWYDTTSNEIKYYNGTTVQAVGAAGAGISSITAGSGLDGGTITTSGTISIATGGVTNAMLASGINASKITAGTLPVGVVPTNTDTTKLPLAGGTMTGAITMGADTTFSGFNLLGAGHITMNSQKTITIGRYDAGQETTLISTLTPANAGATWYNSFTNKLMYWNGTAAMELAETTSAGGDITAINTNAGSGLTGGNTSGPITLAINVDNNTVEISTNTVQVKDAGITNAKLANNAVTSAKILDGEIVNADISATASISWSKIDKTGATAADIGAVPTSRAVNTNAGSALSGGGNLTADRNLSVNVDDASIEVSSNALQVKDGGITNAKIATVNITKLTAGAGDYFSYMPAGTECANGEVLKWNSTTDRWMCGSDNAGVTDHGALTGLSDDDHTQYVLLAGRTGGQNIRGGIASGDDLTLESTSHATKGDILLQPNGGSVGIGTTTPGALFDVEGTIQIGDSGETCSIGANAGMMRYSAGTLQYCNGSAWQTLGVSGAGLTTLNGQTGSTQTFVVNTAGTAPALNSAGNTHTISIPLASTAGVTAGTISKSDYDSFVAKLSSVTGSTLNSARIWVGDSSNQAAAVLMSGDATLSNTGALTIAADAITSAKIADGTITNADINAAAAIAWSKIDKTGATAADIGAVPTARAVNTNAGSALSGGGNLTADRNLSVNVDDASIEVSSNALQVKDGGITNAKIATVNITKLTAGAGDYFSYMPSGTECANGEVLKWNSTTDRWLCGADSGGVTDHGALTGLSDDDHTQYVMLAGRSGGQVVRGGTASGDDITIESTSNITKGDVVIQPSGGNVGIGTTAPAHLLHVNSTAGNANLMISGGFADGTSNLLINTVGDASTSRVTFQKSSVTQGSIAYNNAATGPSQAMNFDVAGGSAEMTILGSGNVGIGTTAPSVALDIEGTVQIGDGGEACSIAANAGMIKYASGALQYCNGSAWQTLGVSGAGLTTLNGQTGSTQTFAVNATGTAPAINSATNTHTISIPLASGAGVTSGTISKTDYDSFVAKLSAVSGSSLTSARIWVGDSGNQAAAVLMSGDATLSNTGALTIANNAITSAKINDGAIVNADINASAAIAWSKIDKTGAVASDVGAVPTSRQINTNAGSGLTGGGDLTANRNLALNVDNSTIEIATNTVQVKDGGITNAKIATVNITKLTAGAGDYFSYMPAGTECANGEVLKWNSTTDRWECGTDSGGVTDHGALTGLSDDDHTQYVMLAGRAGGQVVRGGTASGDDITIESTSNVTKGDVILQPNGGNVGIGTSSPNAKLSVGVATGAGEKTGIEFQDSVTATNASRIRVDGSNNQGLILDLDYNSNSNFDYFEVRANGSASRLLINNAGNVGVGTTAPSAKLDVEGTVQIGDGGEACSIAANAGMIKYASGALQYCNGSAWQTLGVSGAGLTTLNGQTGSTQTFAVNATGTAPAINSATNTHTISIPLASGAGVTSGTISKTDYDSFVAKLSAVSGSSLTSARIWVGDSGNQAAAVLMSGDATLSNTGALTIANNAITSAKINDGAIVNADINASAAIAWSKIDKTGAVASDVGAVPTSRQINTNSGSGLTGGGDLTANRNISMNVDNNTIEIATNTVQVKDGGITNAKINSMNITKLTAGAGDYFSYMPAGTECATGEVLKWNATTDRWECGTDSGGVTDHGALTGLGDDDHTQYVMLAGRAGGQNVRGGTASGDDLTIESTSNATKGDVLIQPNGGNVGIGTSSPATALQVVSNSTSTGLSSWSTSSLGPSSGGGVFGATAAVPTAADQRLGVMGFAGYTTGTTPVAGAAVVGWSSNAWNVADSSSYLTFETTNGSISRSERMRITSTGNIGIGTTMPSTKLDIEGTVQIGDGGEACSIAANAGMIKYASGALQYCNGSAWQTLGVSGAGLTTLNGQTGSTQTFAVNATGTAPTINSASNTHTLSIPLASGAGVTSGTISKTDYDSFVAKLSAVSGSTLTSARIWVGDSGNQAAAVLMSGDATLSNTGALTIANNAITSAKINDGAIVNADINASAAIAWSKIDKTGALASDVGAVPTSRQINTNAGSGLTGGGDLTANRNIALNVDNSTIEIATNTVQVKDSGISTAKIANSAVTDAKINTVSVNKVTSALGQYFTYAPNGGACANGEVLKKTLNGWECGTDAGGVTDHGALTGLGDDDHTQYVMLAGRAGGQIVRGGTASGNDLTLESTSNATKGDVLLQPNGGNVGIGTTSPSSLLDITRQSSATYASSDGGVVKPWLSTDPVLSINNTDSTLGSASYISFDSISGGSTHALAYISSFAESAGTTMGTLAFGQRTGATSYSERMRIDRFGNVGIGTTAPASKLDIEGTLQIGDGGEACSIAANAGMIKYASGTLQYCNGSAWQTLGVSGSGLTTLNGQTGSTQTFAVNATGTAPAINSATNTHTISIPLASGAGVTSGTISKTDYDSFVAKLSAVSGSSLTSARIWVGDSGNQAAAVLMSGDATLSNTGALTIANNAITSAKINDGAIVNSDINASAAIAWSKIDKTGATAADVGAVPTSRQINTNAGSGLTGGGDLTANRNIAMNVDNSTIEIATNTVQLKDSGISTAKIANSAVTDAKINTVSVNKVTSALGQYFTYAPNGGACANGEVLKKTLNGWECGTDTGGVTDHGALTGLSDDDHTQYVMLAGRSGGQVVRGGTASGDDITIESTSNATKGDVIIQPTSGNVGIGTTAPSSKLQIVGGTSHTTATAASLNKYVYNVTPSGNQASGANSTALEANALIPNTNTNQVRNVSGSYVGGGNEGTGQVGNLWGSSGEAWNTGNATIAKIIGHSSWSSSTAGTVTSVVGTEAWSAVSGGTAVSQKGIEVSMESVGGTVTNRYGIHIIAPSGTATNDYGIYQAGNQKNYFSGSVGIGTLNPASKLDVEGTIQIGDGGEACSIAANAGMIKYASGALQYCNGSAWQTLGVSGAGLTTLNGQTGSTQTFAVNATGTAPAINSATNTHTISIPLASGTGVTSGTISKTDYDSFVAKLSAVSGSSLTSARIWVGDSGNQAAAVLMSGDATLSNTGALTIANNAITSAKINDGAIVNSDINASAAIAWSKIDKTGATAADVGAVPTSRQINTNAGSGLTGGGDLTANRNIAMNVDNSTIEIATNTVQVKDAGITNAKIASMSVSKITSGALAYFSYMPAGTECNTGEVLKWDAVTDRWNCGTDTAGVTDHGALTGLGDDDHSQYVMLAGRAGGQVVRGGTASGDDITIESTSNATKGDVIVQPNGGSVGIGTTAPASTLDVAGGIRSTAAIPNLVFSDTNEAADNKVWHMRGVGGQLHIQAVNDLGGGGGSLISIGRSGNDITSFNVSDDLYVNAVSGNVGIGTVSPSYNLSLSGDTTAKTIGMERSSTDTVGRNLTLLAGGSFSGGLNRNGGQLILSSGVATGTGGSNIDFYTATPNVSGTTDNTPTLKMTVLGNGNVGIGTSTPQARLQVNAAIGADRNVQLAVDDTESGAFPAGVRSVFRGDDNGSQTGLVIENRSSTAGLTNGTQVLNRFSYTGGASAPVNAGRIRFGKEQEWTSTASTQDSFLAFDTMLDGSAMAEKMRITSGGRVGIGTGTPATRLDVEGTVQIGDGGEACSIAANAGMIKYTAGTLQYCNGSAWQTLGVSGAGLTTLNGQTGSTQTFAVNATGTAPAINSATNTHTISIPLASGVGVTSGTISKADYDSFVAKLSAVSGSSLTSARIWVGDSGNQAAAVLMSGDATLSNTGALTIANDAITSAKIAADTIVAGDIATNAVTTTEINDGTIATIDIANSAVTDAKINTVSVNKIASAMTQYFTYAPNGSACSPNQVLKWQTLTGWECANDASVTDHGALTGLADDDHTQYVMLAGRAGGQNLRGGTASGDDLTIDSTSNATKGDVLINPTGGNVGIGTTTTNGTLHVLGGSSTYAKSLNDEQAHEIDFLKIRGTSIIQDGDNLMGLDVRGYDGVAYQRAALILGEVDGVPGLNDMPGRLTFFTTPDGGVTAQERMRITQNGNVGIGTTAPNSLLDISSTTGATLTLSRADTVATNGETIGILQFSNNDAQLTTQNIYANIEAQAASAISTDAAAGKLIFRTTGTTVGGAPQERMQINQDGKVGIGTIPAYDLHLSRTGFTSDIMIQANAADAGTPGLAPFIYLRSYAGSATLGAATPSFRFSRAQGVQGAEGFLPNGTYQGQLLGYVWNGTNYTDTGRIAIRSSENHTATALGTDIEFQTVQNGTTTNGVAMVLQNDKRVMIGSGGTASTTLDVDGGITSRPAGTATGETGQIVMRELATNGAQSFTIKAPDLLSANRTWVLPDSSGSSGQVLQTNGAGVLSWTSVLASGSTIGAGAGTVGAPSLSFSGDPNTGFYSNGADVIGVSANGANIFNMSSAGLVSPTTGGGLVTTANGSASAPTFSFAGDPDTGWFRPAADTLASSTGGVERMRFHPSGNVSIGTTADSYPLYVYNLETNTSGTRIGSYSLQYVRPATASTASSRAIQGTVSTSGGTGQNIDALHGGVLNATHADTGAVGNLIGAYGISQNLSTGSVTNMNGVLGIAQNTSSGTVPSLYGGRFSAQNDSTGTVTTLVGSFSDAYIGGGAPAANNYGSLSRLNFASTGTLVNGVGTYNHIYNSSTGTITEAHATRSVSHNLTTGTITSAYGNYVQLINDAGGTVSNWYGLYVTDEGTNANYYSIYTAGATKSYFGGNVGFGELAPSTPVHVTSTSAGSEVIGLQLQNKSTTVGTGITLDLNPTNQNAGTRSSQISAVMAPGLNQTNLIFRNSNSNLPEEHMRLTYQGRLGLATSAPSYILSLGGDTARTIGMERTSVSAVSGSDLSITAGGTKTGETDRNGGNLILMSGAATGTGSSSMEFRTAPAGTTGTANRTATTKMIILGSGDVGIGTMTPVSSVDISALGGAVPASAGVLTLSRADTGVASADTIGKIQFWNNDSNLTTQNIYGDIEVIAAQGITTDAAAGTMIFRTTANTLAGTPQERMRISASGNVGIGSINPGTALDVAGTVRATSFVGDMTSAAGSAAAPSLTFSGDQDTGFFNASSNNIVSVTNAGAKTFDFTTTGLLSPTVGGGFVSSGNGTEAAPTFSFAGDLDTGWWRPAPNTMAASTGGIERLRISSAGDVGIGTSVPDGKLNVVASQYNANLPFQLMVYDSAPYAADVGGGVGLGGQISSTGTYTAFGGIRAGKSNATDGNYSGYLSLYTRTNGAGNTEKVRIDHNGNVGIGTSNPNYSLHVLGTGPAVVAAENNVDDNASRRALFIVRSRNDAIVPGAGFGGYLTFQNEGFTNNSRADVGRIGSDWEVTQTDDTTSRDGNMTFHTVLNGSIAEKMRITSAGDVGIGTIVPSAKLHVLGNTRLEGNVAMGDATPSATVVMNSGMTIGANGGRYGLQSLLTIDNTENLTAARTHYGALIDASSNATDTNIGANNHTIYGVYARARASTTAGTAGAATSVYGSASVATSQSNSTTTQAVLAGSLHSVSHTGTPDVTNGYGINSSFVVNNATASVVTNAHGVNSNVQNTAGNITNGYLYRGSYSGASHASIGSKWGLHLVNETYNYMSGNLGIGVTTPEARLQVNGGLTGSYFGTTNFNGVAMTGSALQISSTANTGNVNMSLQALQGGGVSTGNIIMNTAGGNVGIGSTAPGMKLDVTGSFRNSGAVYMTGIAAGSTGNYLCRDGSNQITSGGSCSTSDIRLKENIAPIENSLEGILSLNGITYDWKRSEKWRGDNRQMGLVAQEVKKVFPEAVTESDKGILGLNYEALIGPIVEAIKDLHAKWFKDHNRIAALELENKKLKDDLEKQKLEMARQQIEINKRLEAIEKMNRAPASVSPKSK